MARRRNGQPAKRATDSLGRLNRELEQRKAELREALQQEAATTEVLKLIGRSTVDLQSVLDSLTRSAARLCNASDAAILLRRGDSLAFGSHFGPIPVDFTAWKVSRNWTAGRAVLDRTTVHVRDLAAEAEEFPEGHAAASRMGYRTILSVPLMREDEPVGALTLRRTEVRPFTERQVGLAESFAAQAVVAIENTRLLDELRQRTADLSEALERQTATSEVLEVISASPGDLAPVFEAMLRNAVRLCNAKFGALFNYQNGVLRVDAEFGLPAALHEHLRKRTGLAPTPGTVIDEVIRTKTAVHVADVAKQGQLSSPAATLGGARAYVAVPLIKGDAVIGVFSIFRQEMKPFTDKQIQLVTSFANQAVIAIENTRLLNELRQRTADLTVALERQTAASEVLQVISSSPGALEPVFNAILENAVRICGAKYGNLLLYDGRDFRIAARISSAPAAWLEVPRSPIIQPGPHNPIRRLLATKQTVHIADARLEPAYLEKDPSFASLVEVAGVRTMLVVPLLREGEVIGVIGIHRQEVRPFSDKQIELVGNFAAQAVIAIENTRLLNELHQRTAELAQLNAELEKRVADQVAEIERMGRLRRFLPPQVADLIVSSGSEKELESHRREITALFCDLRGFTGFAESADPEDVMTLLRAYHAAIGKIIHEYGGTLERFAGDGVMVIFNDPVPLPNPALQAVRMALEMRTAIGALVDTWQRMGHELGFGIGISHGYATLGTIGFEGRYDYAAIGTVANLASRLCDEAKSGQILISARVLLAVEKDVTVEPTGELTLKGIRRPVPVYNVVGLAA